MNKLAIVKGRVWDDLGSQPQPGAVILIEDGYISACGSEAEVDLPRDCPVIDASGLFVMPGLIDLHVHICLGLNDNLAWNSILEVSIPELTLRAAARAARSLAMGFTTLRDVGDIGNVGAELAKAHSNGLVQGARLVASGKYLATTGGHGDYLPLWLRRDDARSNVVDGPESIRLMVRRQNKRGCTWMKFVASGLSNTDPTNGVQFSEAEMRALIDEAHRLGCRVAAHSINAASARAAVECGVDTLEHGLELSEETLALMKDRGTWLVPTLTVSHLAVARGREAGLPDYKMKVFPILLERHLKTFRRALEAGVNIALGTDAGYSPVPHAANALELELLADNGLGNLGALKAGTSGAARALGRSDLGVIAPGKIADLILVKGNPLTEVTLLQKENNIALVLQDGRIAADRRDRSEYVEKGTV